MQGSDSSVIGWVVAAASRPARKGGVLVGLSLLSSGALAMSIGLAFALRGSFDKVATKVFLLSPADVDVSPEERRRIAELHLGGRRVVLGKIEP